MRFVYKNKLAFALHCRRSFKKDGSRPPVDPARSFEVFQDCKGTEKVATEVGYVAASQVAWAEASAFSSYFQTLFLGNRLEWTRDNGSHFGP